MFIKMDKGARGYSVELLPLCVLGWGWGEMAD